MFVDFAKLILGVYFSFWFVLVAKESNLAKSFLLFLVCGVVIVFFYCSPDLICCLIGCKSFVMVLVDS